MSCVEVGRVGAFSTGCASAATTCIAPLSWAICVAATAPPSVAAVWSATSVWSGTAAAEACGAAQAGGAAAVAERRTGLAAAAAGDAGKLQRPGSGAWVGTGAVSDGAAVAAQCCFGRDS